MTRLRVACLAAVAASLLTASGAEATFRIALEHAAAPPTNHVYAAASK